MLQCDDGVLLLAVVVERSSAEERSVSSSRRRLGPEVLARLWSTLLLLFGGDVCFPRTEFSNNGEAVT